jgi:hypothetical protein
MFIHACCPGTKAGNQLFFGEISDTSPPLPSVSKCLLPVASLYPTGTASASIRRTMLANNRRVR